MNLLLASDIQDDCDGLLLACDTQYNCGGLLLACDIQYDCGGLLLAVDTQYDCGCRANCKSFRSQMNETSTNDDTSSDDFTTGVIIINAMIGVAAVVALTVVVWSVCRKEVKPTSGGSNGDRYTRMCEIDSMQGDSRNSADLQQDNGLQVLSRKSPPALL